MSIELDGNSRMNVVYSLVEILLRRQSLQNHLILNFNDEKQEILACRNTLRQTKSCINNNIKPAKINVIDPTEDNFTQPLSIKEILDE